MGKFLMSKCDCRCCRVYGPIPDHKQEEENMKAILELTKRKKKWWKK